MLFTVLCADCACFQDFQLEQELRFSGSLLYLNELPGLLLGQSGSRSQFVLVLLSGDQLRTYRLLVRKFILVDLRIFIQKIGVPNFLSAVSEGEWNPSNTVLGNFPTKKNYARWTGRPYGCNLGNLFSAFSFC